MRIPELGRVKARPVSAQKRFFVAHVLADDYSLVAATGVQYRNRNQRRRERAVRGCDVNRSVFRQITGKVSQEIGDEGKISTRIETKIDDNIGRLVCCQVLLGRPDENRYVLTLPGIHVFHADVTTVAR